MHWQAKVELFEQLRRDYQFGGLSIRSLARRYGIHRRTVRQALASALPPLRKSASRPQPRLSPIRDFIDAILAADLHAPRKQRHTAHRIFTRLQAEHPDCLIAESTVRQYVRQRKAELGLLRRDTFVPQAYQPGAEAQVDWYEAIADIDGERRTLHVFSMRSMWSGGAFHRAYPAATQQAFLEAHEYGFAYFGGVFHTLRYDNLPSAVKKILRGHRREETARFIAFRSHWQFASEFCNPACGNEKGGVEGEVGYFRRNHFVPVPVVPTLAALNQRLADGAQADQARLIGERQECVGVLMGRERESLLPLPAEGFELAEESFCVVDTKGCISARTNSYSTPLRAGTRCRVRVLPQQVEVWHGNRMVASHERCYGRRQQVLSLEHYLDVLARKPGALKGSKPLQQWRREGRWTAAYDELWHHLQQRHGSGAGTRLMIEVMQLGRQVGYERLSAAIETALKFGAWDVAAVRYLLTAAEWHTGEVAPLEASEVARPQYYTRPLPPLHCYDELLGRAACQEVTP